MLVNFNIKYDPIHNKLSVEQDGVPVNNYSQFSRCNNKNFSDWFRYLPQYAFTEANGNYTVVFQGGIIYGEILKAIFSKDIHCKEYILNPNIIKGSDRIKLADELNSIATIKAPILNFNIYSYLKNFDLDMFFINSLKIVKENNIYRFANIHNLPINLCVTNTFEYNVLFVLVSDYNEFKRIANTYKKNTPLGVIIAQENGYKFIEECNNCFLFNCENSLLIDFIRVWIYDFILPEYLISLYKIWKNENWNGNLNNEIIKMEMLLRSEPYLKLEAPKNIEINESKKIKFIKFPEDMPCTICTETPDVAVFNKDFTIKPLKEGKAVFLARSKEYPQYYTKTEICIYKYYRVNKIQLSVNNNILIVGDKFKIDSIYTPQNADNIHKAKWTIKSDCIELLNKDIFYCRKSGVCIITQSVENVTESITLTVYPKAQNIDFCENDISIKLGDNSKKVIPTISPLYSKKYYLKYTVSNNGIIDYNSNNGNILTKSEGTAIIKVELLDENRNVTDKSYCKIRVMPPKKVVTPEGSLIFTIVSFLCTILFYNTSYREFFAIILILGLIIFSFSKKNKKIYVICIIIIFLIVLFLLGGANYIERYY